MLPSRILCLFCHCIANQWLFGLKYFRFLLLLLVNVLVLRNFCEYNPCICVVYCRTFELQSFSWQMYLFDSLVIIICISVCCVLCIHQYDILLCIWKDSLMLFYIFFLFFFFLLLLFSSNLFVWTMQCVPFCLMLKCFLCACIRILISTCLLLDSYLFW